MFSADPSSGRVPARILGRVLAALGAAGPTAVALVDGPSGAGKSTLADALVAAWPGTVPPTLVRLDDIYPGWRGLTAAAAHVTTHLLEPRRAGRAAGWRRYDWARGCPAEWHPVAAGRPLIVEGCGALAAGNVAVSDVRVWLDADDRLRKQRALARDGEPFRAHWDEWQGEWEGYLLREHPDRWATIRLRMGRSTVSCLPRSGLGSTGSG